MFISLVAALLSTQANATPGDLDPNFGSGGKVVTAIGISASAYSVIEQTDGKLVAAGYSDDGSGLEFALVRYNSDGSLDTTFDDDGKVITNIGSGSSNAQSVIQQADGKLVVAGSGTDGSQGSFALARYNDDGTPDIHFGNGGVVTTSINAESAQASSLIQQKDGKLVAAGRTHDGSKFRFLIIRYNADGTPDKSFGDNGVVLTGIEDGSAVISSVIQQQDGKLVAAGYWFSGAKSNLMIARYNKNGALDQSFSSGGLIKWNRTTATYYINSIIEEPGGKLVVAGYVNEASVSKYYVVHFNKDGSFDNYFGEIKTQIGAGSSSAFSMVRQFDGSIVVAGQSGDNPVKFSMARYTPLNRSLDAGFGIGGKVVTGFGSGTDSAKAIIQQRDGKLVAAGSGWTGTGFQFAIARYDSSYFDKDDMPDDFSGEKMKKGVGGVVAFIGDFNGDGYGDYGIGVPGHDAPVINSARIIKGAGRANIISGKDGAMLASVTGEAAKDAMGYAVAGNADIDNDGYDDVVVGAPKSGLLDQGGVMILFGPDGSRKQFISGEYPGSLMGYSLALGDISGDDRADIMIGAPREDDAVNHVADAGSVNVLSGDGYASMLKVYGQSERAYAGSAVAAGHYKGGGAQYLIVGAPQEDNVLGGIKRSGSVAVYDSSGDVVLRKYGQTKNSKFGSVIVSGDMNKDGYDELIVGAPSDDREEMINNGSFTVFSGNTGAELLNYSGDVFGTYGSSLAIGDVNGDGFYDVMAGVKDGDLTDSDWHVSVKDCGYIDVWSGKTFDVIDTVYGENKGDSFGSAISSGDINGDGKDDLLIGAPGFDSRGVNQVRDVGIVRVLSASGL